MDINTVNFILFHLKYKYLNGIFIYIRYVKYNNLLIVSHDTILHISDIHMYPRSTLIVVSWNDMKKDLDRLSRFTVCSKLDLFICIG